MIEFEKTAINVKKTMMQGVCYSVYKGENRIYGVLAEGGCATFIVVSLDRKKIIFSQDAPGATGSWGVCEASDGRIYFGSYVNGGLYRFDPRVEKFETLFDNLPNAKFIFSLDADNENNIYGGTWPNCAVFKYNGISEKLDFYDEKIITTEDYVRLVLYNHDRKSLYASISAHSHVVEYKEGIGIVRDIFPMEYRKESFVIILGFYNNAIYANMPQSHEIVAIDLDSGEVLKKLPCPAANEEILPMGIDVSRLIMGYRSGGYTIDPQNDRIYHFIGEDDDTIMGIWPYSDGESVITSSFGGCFFLYNTITGKRTDFKIEIPRKSIEIRQLHMDRTGTIYSTGYLKGGHCIYDPETDTGIQYDGVGQSEGITSGDGKIYFGKYPGAYIYEFDPEKPWNMPGNPRELFELKTPANQDRPFAIKVFDEKLYIGTIPNYGDIQGALTVYDIKNKKHTIRKDFSDSRSIVSLEYKNGILYGGTTVCGGLGSYTKQESGTVFALDTKNDRYIYEVEPVSGCKNAGGLCLTPEGKLLGCADSTFFIMDSETGNVEYTKKLAEFNRNKDYKWEVSFIKKGPGKLYYIVTANTLFSLDLQEMVFDQLEEKQVNLLEFDKKGRLYCQYEDNVREIIRSKKPVL
ncbi:MAG: hypothetical protein JXN10_06810 [Clostridia bacterium]|nr:hypothetical protein [Clostridia bacterium]MBN2883222.1 hypothetical protein [Clostridia bacterium]